MGISIDNSVKNLGAVSSIRAASLAQLTAVRNHLFIAQDTNELYYRDKLGILHNLTSNGGGGSGGSGEVYEVQQYNANAAYVVPQTYRLREVIIIPGTDSIIRVGTTANGNDLYDDNLITSIDGEILEVPIYALSNSKTLYFTGLPTSTYIVFFKTQINLPLT